MEKDIYQELTYSRIDCSTENKAISQKPQTSSVDDDFTPVSVPLDKVLLFSCRSWMMPFGGWVFPSFQTDIFVSHTRTLSSGFLTRFDTNRVLQPQKIAAHYNKITFLCAITCTCYFFLVCMFVRNTFAFNVRSFFFW